MYFLYLIRCGDGTIYTGITTDVRRRFKEHQAGSGGRYTKAKKAVKVLYIEKFPTRSAAMKRESEIKKWRREKKLNLIESNL
jgi:putative endonuclease